MCSANRPRQITTSFASITPTLRLRVPVGFPLKLRTHDFKQYLLRMRFLLARSPRLRSMAAKREKDSLGRRVQVTMT